MTVIDGTCSTRNSIPTITLNDAATMPVLGLGVAKLSDAETEGSVTKRARAARRTEPVRLSSRKVLNWPKVMAR